MAKSVQKPVTENALFVDFYIVVVHCMFELHAVIKAISLS